MYMTTVRLASPGPPLVKATMESNSCSVLIIVIVTLNRITGLSSGMVMRKSTVGGFAPSILAASYSSSEMFCSPASVVNIVKPTFFQTYTKITDQIAQALLVNQGIGGTLKKCR